MMLIGCTIWHMGAGTAGMVTIIHWWINFGI